MCENPLCTKGVSRGGKRLSGGGPGGMTFSQERAKRAVWCHGCAHKVSTHDTHDTRPTTPALTPICPHFIGWLLSSR